MKDQETLGDPVSVAFREGDKKCLTRNLKYLLCGMPCNASPFSFHEI